ncbi:hypothetical protein DSO57_1025605 [Entomophthora muscae]|uniref:Uncharacterized protein n=1 Tax=Entomophthora muscae TaxID=34485 RepID=A0ACC2SR79_9FUNG|nr:hypothetical protein DSO57_1025605 [Entomophthora muscae]
MSDIEVVSGRQLLRKLDVRIVPYLVLLYTLCFLDRVSIGHARLYGLEQSLGLSQSQYSWTLSVFFIGYILFEVPSNLMMKKVSPPVWIARIMVTWGLVTMCMAATRDFNGLMATRFFLGVAEAGLFPGIIFLMSFWYTRQEQGIRIAFLSASSQLAGSFGGIISYGISYIDGNLGLRGWQWIFIVEGIPTVVFGTLAWWIVPTTPRQASWLSTDEREFLVQKLEASHVDLEVNRISIRQIRACFADPKTYLYAFLYLGLQCPMYSLSLLMPTIISDMGVSNVSAMLMTTPPCALAFVVTIANAWHSDRTLDRGFHIVATCTLAILGFVIMILATPLALRYSAIMITMVGSAASFPPTLSWSNNNQIGSTKAAVSSAFIIAFGNIGGFFSGQMYRAEEGPRYTTSHLINIAALAMSITCALTLRAIMKAENTRLDKNEAAVSEPDLPTSPAHGTNPTPKFRYIL